MTMIQTIRKYCFCMDLRIACYISTSFLLASYIALASWIIHNTVTIPARISLKDPDAMKKLTKVLIIAQFLFPVALTLIKYKIILLIGIKKKSRFVINVYLMFAKYALFAYTMACIAFQLYCPMDPYANGASLLIPLHASFMYLIRNYWKKLPVALLKNIKMQQHSV